MWNKKHDTTRYEWCIRYPDNYGAQINTGAYVALDPGAGPADTTVWITNKPNLCTKRNNNRNGLYRNEELMVALHNGGNRSIVANDFTQVITDGIGMWCNEMVKQSLYLCLLITHI